MDTETMQDHHGQLAGHVTLVIGCPVCEGQMVVENGVLRKVLGVGREAIVLLRCAAAGEHGVWEVKVNLARVSGMRVPISGAEQRKRRAAARAAEGLGDERQAG